MQMGHLVAEKSNGDMIERQRGETSMRSSNIELLRIVAMLAIVAHHYVVNSTVTSLFDPLHPTANSIFLQLWGMWGKTAINVFVLITGYFMCESKLTVKRYCKILFEIIFYSWVMWFVLSAFGHETITWKGAVKRLILHDITANQDGGFVPGFMWMYLLIPAMNVYLRNATTRNLYWTLGVLLTMFSLCGTFLNANVYHHVFWYCTLYFVGAAIRNCPFAWMGSMRACASMLILSIVVAWASVIGIDHLTVMLGRTWINPYFFVSDSNKILAFLAALFAFLMFKNWRIPQSLMINGIAQLHLESC